MNIFIDSFIGSWKCKGTKIPPKGQFVFLNNGEVQIQSLENSSLTLDDGAVLCNFVSLKGTDAMARVSFTIDTKCEDDILVFQGVLYL